MSEQSLTKEEFWRLRINDYRNCGLTAAEWCKQNQISLSTLRYWIHRLNKKQSGNLEEAKPVFAELPGLTTASFLGTAPVIIHMGTVHIEIMDSCHPDLLSNLIATLKYHA